ncbi:MAG: MupA/Atu3671 family FMN-dependent luciferase-like monooxygenase [Verrucomicrobiota bacterium]
MQTINDIAIAPPPTRRSATALQGEAKVVSSREAQRPIKPMAFSLFLWGNDDAPGRDKYRLMIEGAKYFDRHGFEAVWTPERHFHAFGGPYPNPSVTGAALAAVTERLGIRAGSCVSPLHHPIRIAEEWAVVDNLSNGRVAIAFASGWQLNDFVLCPENHAENKRVMLEQIDQVRRLWRGEKIAFRNPLGQEVLIQTLPRPVQPDLPLWITTAGNPDTYRQAGELGGNVLTHLLGQTLEQVAEKIAVYRQARAAAGHDPATGRVTLMLHTLVGGDDAEVRELVRRPMKDYLRSSLKLVAELAGNMPAFVRAGDANSKSQDVDLRALPEREIEALLDVAFERYYETSGLFGTPATCARMVECCRNAGVDEIACLLDFGVPTARVLDSLENLNDLRERANTGPVSAERTATPSVSSANHTALKFTRADNGHVYSFLAKLRERNIRVSADGGQLRCSAPAGALTAELKEELKQHKREILQFLQSAGALARQQRAIVPLQPHGTRAPVFGVAGHNGDVFCYRFLAQHLGEDQPFFGLEPPGLDGQSEPLARVEDLAAYFAGQIREFRPDGPCIIAGFCSGGGIALEVAHQLVRDGTEVNLLALFGCPFPTWYRPLPQLRARVMTEANRVLRHARAVATLSFADLRSYIAERWHNLTAERAAARSSAPDPLMQRRDQLARVTIAALCCYRPASFPGRVCLILPTRSLLDLDEVVTPWRNIAPRTEDYYGPDGSTGDTMLREPYAAAFADLFHRCRNRSS